MTDREMLAMTIATTVRQVRDEWREETCGGDATDFRRGYVTAVHGLLDDLEERLGKQMILLASSVDAGDD